MNVAIVSGHLGKAPEMHFTKAGKPICGFTLATTEKWTDDQGQKREQTEWHRIVVFGGQAEACGKYLDKGSLVEVEGKIQTRTWDDKDGNKLQSTEIVASRVGFLGGAKSRGGEQPRAPRQPAAPASPKAPDDFPFA